jgi:hypothetical protein
MKHYTKRSKQQRKKTLKHKHRGGDQILERIQRVYSRVECPVSFSLLDEYVVNGKLNDTRRGGEGLVDIFERAYVSFREKLPGYTDAQIANLWTVTVNFLYPSIQARAPVPIMYGPYGQIVNSWDALFELEKQVTREAKRLEQASNIMSTLENLSERMTKLEINLRGINPGVQLATDEIIYRKPKTKHN